MTDLAKWALMLLGITAIIAVLAVGINELNILTIGTGFAESLNDVLQYVSSPIRAARGFINNLAGSPVPCDVIFFCLLVMPFIRLTAKVMIAVYRWIFK